MREFWQQYDPVPESMLLNSHSHVMQDEERNEILSCLPDVKGLRVLELGAGIGRFTGLLASTASHVTAVDFMESYVETNRRAHDHMGNIRFIQADVTDLELPENSFDVIFSNWLLMYLCDSEVSALVEKMLGWVVEGGILFVRESCYRPSGNVKRTTNPTFYRSPLDYLDSIQKQSFTHRSFFVLDGAKSIRTYIKYYGNPFQVAFLFNKMSTQQKVPAQNRLQEFLDTVSYNRRSIFKFERVYGKSFVSTGGERITKTLCQELKLKAGERVLDVGCGNGGAAFHLAKAFRVCVVGIDLSTNMIDMALRYQDQEEDDVKRRVGFELNDVTKKDYACMSFDVIYSRDCLRYVSDKKELLTKFLKWLKPGGRLLITDYCRGRHAVDSGEFKDYAKSRGFHLLALQQYGRLLREIGFREVRDIDFTSQFVETLKVELHQLEDNRSSFIQEFSEEEYDEMTQNWKTKVRQATQGELGWGLFLAKK